MTIKEIKSRLKIYTVLRHYGLFYDNNHMIRCPFHSDKKPSMKIYPETNTAFCFAGSCPTPSVDAIDFIMNVEKCSKHEALKIAESLIDPSIPKPKKNLTMIPQSSPDIELLTDLFKYFEKGIKHPQAK